MSNKNKHKDEEIKNEQEQVEVNATAEATAEQAEATAEEVAAEADPVAALEARVAELEAQIEKEKKEYLFLMADFDNFRKNSLKQKAEIIKNGAEKAMLDLLPVVDDFDRARDAMATTDDVNALREGLDLIYDKFLKYLEKNNVKPMDANGTEFNPDLHEAIANFPVDDDDKKGKVFDTMLKGYTINDKVLRHAKVVVGQ